MQGDYNYSMVCSYTNTLVMWNYTVLCFNSGNSSDLVSYWLFLDPSKKDIVRQYEVTLRKMEDEC